MTQGTDDWGAGQLPPLQHNGAQWEAGVKLGEHRWTTRPPVPSHRVPPAVTGRLLTGERNGIVPLSTFRFSQTAVSLEKALESGVR